MKEPNHQDITQLTKTRSGSMSKGQNRVHQRGDKVVVNGAKQSLMAILRQHTCICGRHNLQKATSRFLMMNKVSASYDLVVWMFIYLRINQILGEYLKKMNKKKDQDQTHHSVKYIQSKKSTLKKFIQSAEYLSTDQMSSQEIEKSVGVLYSKGKSKEDAIKKMINYLKKVNAHFQQHDSLIYQQSSCCFQSTHRTLPKKTQLLSPQNQSMDLIQSLNQPESLSVSFPETEKPVKESPYPPDDQSNKSYRPQQKGQSFDLFDNLIRTESVDSPSRNFIFFH